MLPIYFAPLQGYTDSAYRNAHYEIFGGIERYYTPFIRIERGGLRPKDIRDSLPENDTTGRLVPQIIVKDVNEFSFLVDKLQEMGHKQIDVNMGCPFPLQTNKGRGAGILSYPDKVIDLLNAINVREDIDFSLKMRLGNENPIEVFNLIPILNDTRLTHVTLHPRIGKQQYKGEINFEEFGHFIDKCNHNIIYNGDILSVDDIKRIEAKYPQLKGIMIGRGLLMCPSLALEYMESLEFSEEKRLQDVKKLHNKLIEYYSDYLQGESHLLMKMKTFWEYLEGLIGYKKYKAIKKSISMAKYNSIIATI